MKVYIVRHREVPHHVLKMYNNENEDLIDTGIDNINVPLKNNFNY